MYSYFKKLNKLGFHIRYIIYLILIIIFNINSTVYADGKIFYDFSKTDKNNTYNLKITNLDELELLAKIDAINDYIVRLYQIQLDRISRNDIEKIVDPNKFYTSIENFKVTSYFLKTLLNKNFFLNCFNEKLHKKVKIDKVSNGNYVKFHSLDELDKYVLDNHEKIDENISVINNKNNYRRTVYYSKNDFDKFVNIYEHNCLNYLNVKLNNLINLFNSNDTMEMFLKEKLIDLNEQFSITFN